MPRGHLPWRPRASDQQLQGGLPFLEAQPLQAVDDSGRGQWIHSDDRSERPLKVVVECPFEERGPPGGGERPDVDEVETATRQLLVGHQPPSRKLERIASQRTDQRALLLGPSHRVRSVRSAGGGDGSHTAPIAPRAISRAGRAPAWSRAVRWPLRSATG